MIKITLLLFISLLLFAQQYPYFSASELKSIKKSNPISLNRILDYQNYIFSCKTDSKAKQLNKINFYLNRLLPQYDAVINKKEDNWATPKEFLSVGYGDCEDYVIIKYYSLLQLGFDKKKLFFAVVKEKFYGGYHMVLAYYSNPLKPPLILDNLSFKILTLEKRSDLQAQLLINTTGVYKVTKDLKLKKVAQKYKEFEELQFKIKHNL